MQSTSNKKGRETTLTKAPFPSSTSSTNKSNKRLKKHITT